MNPVPAVVGILHQRRCRIIQLPPAFELYPIFDRVVNIFIRLLEGVETWVPVPGISHGDLIVEIIENQYLDLENDVTSIWEFFPGDIVSCKISDGRLVASKLLQSTFSDRKIYELIFLIVESMGEIPLDQLYSFESEIERLRSDSQIVQRNHPLVSKWLKRNS